MNLIFILLILLIVTRVCGVLVHRLGQPPLVGEILGGVLLGILATHFAGTVPMLGGLRDNEVLRGIADLGIFFLMLLAGIELRPRELAERSGKSVLIAIGGFFIPLATGIGAAWLFIPESTHKIAQCLFVGTALAITAVPVAVKVLMDIGQLDTKVGRTVVSAAVFDDVFSLILLTVLVAVIATGSAPDAASLALLAGKIVLFFAVTAFLGVYAFPVIGRLLVKIPVKELEFSGLIIVAMIYALLAELLGLHFIIGAFVAGLFFNRRIMDKQTYTDVQEKISGITTGFLGPIFFATIGLHIELSAVVAAPVFLTTLLAVAILGKFVGAGLVAYVLDVGTRPAIAIGAAMTARGAVELIVADVALQADLFSVPEPVPNTVSSLFSAIVIVAIVTTLVAPIIMRLALGRK